MTTASPAFDNYRSVYPARPPDLARQRFADETRLLSSAEGVDDLSIAPIKLFERGVPPGMQVAESINKYLWVVAVNAVPIAIEQPRAGVTVGRGYLSHTNLTGGAAAHCGGELWFTDDSTVILNGGSSRYAPRTKAELDDIARSFKVAGYRAATMGWNDETAASFRSLRGDPQWL